MSYTPMSDLGQQGLFDITRTLLHQSDLPSLCQSLTQLVRQSGLADSAAIVLWNAEDHHAHYYAARADGRAVKYEDDTLLAHGPVRRILSRPEALHCNYAEFCDTWPQLAASSLYEQWGHYSLLPLAVDGRIFGGCEFIRQADTPWSEKEYARLHTLTQLTGVVVEHIQQHPDGASDHDDLVSEVAKEIHHYFHIDAISIVLRSSRKGKLNIYSTHYPTDRSPVHEQSEVDEAGTLSERVFESKDVLVLKDPDAVPATADVRLHAAWRTQAGAVRWRNLYAVHTIVAAADRGTDSYRRR
ncbi:MAG: fhlA [Enterobacter kobei]|nr:fhlA [Enterobacter kobei]